MLVTFSLLEGQEVVNATEGQMIVLPAKVTGITIVPGPSGTDSTVLTRVAPFLPSLYAPHPDAVNFPNATLREYRIRSIRSFNEVRVDLIYRAPGPSDWLLEEISQSEYLQTFTTANGQAPIVVWFSAGASNTLEVPPGTLPTGVSTKGASVQKYQGRRILRARGWMKQTDWKTVRKTVRSALWTINATQWGDDQANDKRGCWLFANMNLSTNDLGRTRVIELFFYKTRAAGIPSPLQEMWQASTRRAARLRASFAMAATAILRWWAARSR